MTSYSATVIPSSNSRAGSAAATTIVASVIIPIVTMAVTCCVGIWKRSILKKCCSSVFSGSSSSSTGEKILSSAVPAIAAKGLMSGSASKVVLGGTVIAGVAVAANAANNKLKNKKIEKLEKENRELKGEQDIENQKSKESIQEEVVVVIKESVNKGIAFSKAGAQTMYNEVNKKISNKPPKREGQKINAWENHRSRIESVK